MIEFNGESCIQTVLLPLEAESIDEFGSYTEAMDQAPIGITIADLTFQDEPIVYVNDGFVELTGYQREEVLGRNCRFLQGEQTCEETVSRIREAIENTEQVTVELRNYRKDGSLFWNELTLIPIRDGDGSVTKYLGYQQDITARKQFEESVVLFEAYAEESDRSIVITDSEGVIEYINPAFEELNGYTESEVIGSTFNIVNSGYQDDTFYAELWQTITAGEVWEAELINKTKYGEFYEAKHTIIPVMVESDEITHYIVVGEDITENVLTRQGLDVLNRIVRHNLRNSLNVIDGYAELLGDDALSSEQRAEMVSVIRKQVTEMNEISEKAADVRSIWEASEMTGMYGTVNVRDVIRRCQSEYVDADIQCGKMNVEEVHVQNTGLFVNALREAIDNAVTHTDQSVPEVTVTVVEDVEAGQYHVCIRDNGPGIPELERAVIDSGEETPLGHSLGIGLWMMKWIVKTLGGELVIHDRDSDGTMVVFQLPIEQPQITL